MPSKRRKSIDKKDQVGKKVEETFLGDTVPAVIKSGMPLFHKISNATFDATLKEATSFLQGKPSAELEVGESKLSEEQLQLVFTCIVTVLKAGFRERHKALDLKTDLSKLNFPDRCVEAFLKVIKKKRKKIEKIAIGSSIRYPTLKSANWRVDVTISTSSLSRVLKPSVLMQLTLSDGSVKTFEMQVDQFHQLRYNVAKVLQYMRKVENRAIMSLVADLEVGKLKHS